VPETAQPSPAAQKAKKEPLQGDLRKYLRQTPFGTMIHHPLMVYLGVNVEHAAYVHYVIEQKQRHMQKCRVKGDYLGVLAMYERPYLLQGLTNEMPFMDHGMYWEALGEVWTDIEAPWPNRDIFLDLFRNDRPKRERMMKKGEHKAFAKLPKTITVYRGFIGRRGRGLSWTTSREKAIWFAKRFAEVNEGTSQVMTGVVNKSDVLAFFTRRKESEIVVDPAMVRRQIKEAV
jgi:hypothetical protein